MDSRVNLMMIVGIWLLRPALDRAALRERLESRFLAYPRFRQKAVEQALHSDWVDDDDFDIDRHLVRESWRESAARANVLPCRHAPASSPPSRWTRHTRCGRST